ncbi:MAG: hypothetical protein ABI972_21770 [Acidobacteriota bacterium]
MRRIVLFAFAAATASAQFADFAVTDDGRLFFTTPLSTGAEDMRTKVYRVDSSGVSLYATGGEPALYGPNAIGPNAVAPFTSGDGSITGYGRNSPDCNPRCSAFALPRTFFTIDGLDGFANVPYNTLQISRNARFLLGSTSDYQLRRIELPSGNTYVFPPNLVPIGRFGISNSGAALMRDARDDSPLLYAPYGEQPRVIPGTDAVRTGFLSPNGDRIVYLRSNGLGFDLILTDPQGSAHRVLATAPAESLFQPSFANDGTLLFLDASGQPMVLAAAAAEPRLLLTLDGGAKAAILSGNGQIAWFTTANGRLIRVRTTDLGIDEFIPETLDLDAGRPYTAAPGSVIRLFGSGLPERTRFTLDGTPLPLSEPTGQRAAVQVPWEFPATPGERTLLIENPGSPFHLAARFLPVLEPTVTFERGNTRFDTVLQAAHQDFRSVVSASDLARPGETIHVFARNLGPVDQPVATGQRSPASPPARIVTPLTCTLQATGVGNPSTRIDPLVIPFAGLSGGSVGIYQIDVTIPADWSSTEALLRCGFDFRADIDRIFIAALR